MRAVTVETAEGYTVWPLYMCGYHTIHVWLSYYTDAVLQIQTRFHLLIVDCRPWPTLLFLLWSSLFL
jgi:hypothetical protein